jgi:hypothetical protein
MRRHYLWMLLVLAIAGFFLDCRYASAQDPNVLESFAVKNPQDIILLPVQFEGKQHLFLLNTGCTYTAYHRPLLREKSKYRTTANSTTGPIEAEVFDAPQAWLGKFDLKLPTEIVAKDLDFERQITGIEVHGYLGMDFLHKHVLQIDFGNNEVRFLGSVSRAPGWGRQSYP